jgi:serine protease Do
MDDKTTKLTSVKPTWRNRLSLKPRTGFSIPNRVRRASFGLGALLIAAAAGFGGGLLANRNTDTINTSSLSSQRKIVSSQDQLISQISKEVGPSVVSITTSSTQRTTDLFGYSTTQDQKAAGTGMIISKQGYILTNRHVVASGTKTVAVTLQNGTTYDDVEIVGRTSSGDSLDVAILKIKDLKGQTLKPVTFGSSGDASVGNSVVAIGNALGQFENTVTSGIISGFGRSVTASDGGYNTGDSEDLVNLIQTDAAINQGNSGGPLVDLNGRVIGINTAIASDAQSIGFAIPIDDVRGLINRILATGKFERPYLGVRYVQLDNETAEAYGIDQTKGAYVVPSAYGGSEPVVADSPAEKAGLKAGDVITKVNDDDVTKADPLSARLNKYQVGDSVDLTVVRSGKTIHLTAKLDAAPTN